MAGIWPRLNIARLRKCETLLRDAACDTYLSASPARSCWDSRIRLRTPICISKKNAENARALIGALRDLGFVLSEYQNRDLERGKDFVQLKNGPFDLDLIFAPDGIERFEDAWRRHVEVEGFPVCHLDDIIASKVAANRQKDREGLPRLKAFRDYWLGKSK